MQQKPLFSIVLVVFVDLLGFSLILPLLPYYAETFGASPFVTGLLVASYAVAQLAGAPLLGRLSDKYGRRPVLIASVAGTLLGFLLLGFARSLWMLFASRLLDGLTGGNISVAQAYIADVTDVKDRSRGLGMIGAAFGLGFIIGPASGGFLSQWGYAVPAFAAAALAAVNLGLIVKWLPESLPVDKRTAASRARAPVNLAALIVALRRPFTGPLLIVRFYFGTAFAVLQTIFSLYALTALRLSAQQTGFMLTYVGLVSVITQGYLVGRLSRRFREDVLIVWCAALMGVALAGWAMAASTLGVLFVLTPIAFAGGTLNTVLTATLTKAVEPREIGGILGLSTAVESATRIIAPAIGGALLQELGTWAPGAFGALVMAGVFAYAWRTIRNHPIAASLEARRAPTELAP